jgi:hypothetical protein
MGAGGAANFSKVNCGVAGGDMHAAAESDGQILKVAPDADALGVNIQRGPGRASVLLSELHPVEFHVATEAYPHRLPV